MDLRVISIGTLPAHPLWDEKGAVRTGHATTTLIRSGKRTIIVDPGLPAQVVAARLHERSGLRPESVTHVFLTSFKPETCRGILAFEKATWWVSAPEREGVGVPLVGELQAAAAAGDEELRSRLELDVAVLRRCEPAPERVADGVDLFPLVGVTPGLTGLLLPGRVSTTLVCGDAVPTIEHLERGMVLQSAVDVARARESLAEAVEIADFLVPGRDNMVPNPVRRPF
jgi:glyoxylase-like metal-dependent hydrolase (beta-lactamase superfamily II)